MVRYDHAKWFRVVDILKLIIIVTRHIPRIKELYGMMLIASMTLRYSI